MSGDVRTKFIKGAMIAAAIAAILITGSTWLRMLKIMLLSVLFMLLLAPLCLKLEQRGMNVNAAALISMMVCLIVLSFFLLVFIPYFLTGIVDFVRRTTPTVLAGIEKINERLIRFGMVNTLKADTSQLIASALKPITAGIARGSAAVISTTGHIAFSLVIAYYLLTVRQAMGAHAMLCIPLRFRRLFLSALYGCKNAVLSYLSGTLKTSAFVGFATLVGLLILGIKDALILAVFMSILEILPYIGPILGAIPIVVSAVPLGIGKLIMALIVVFLIQQLEASVVGPYFTASSTSIHPLTSIIGVFLGGSLFGIAGILLTTPALIVLRSMVWSIRSASIQIDS